MYLSSGGEKRDLKIVDVHVRPLLANLITKYITTILIYIYIYKVYQDITNQFKERNEGTFVSYKYND